MDRTSPVTQGKPAAPPRGARIAQLVGSCQHILFRNVRRWIDPVFTETREYYFQCAENADNNEAQNRYFEGIRELKAHETAFSDRFAEAMGDALGRLPNIEPVKHVGEEPKSKGELSLVEDEDLEEGLAISDLVAKLEIKHSQELHALNQRLSVINSGRTIANENNPCSPQAIGKAMRDAAQCLEMHVSLRVALYRNFELELSSDVATLYSEINAHLIKHGILPNLHYEKHRTPDAAGASEPAQQPTPDEEEPGPDTAFGRQTVGATGADLTGRSGGQQMAPASGGRGNSLQSAEDTELFDSIRQLLSGQRSRGGQGHGPGPGLGSAGSQFPAPMPGRLSAQQPGRPTGGVGHFGGGAAAPLQVSTDDIQSVLSAMQGSRASGSTSIGGVKDLRQELVSNLRGLGTDGQDVELTGADSDTIDIVDMMFEFIKSEREVRDHAQDLLTKLEIPLLKVALKDKRLFTQRDHPAREFLNGLAEAGSVWVEEEDKNSQTFQKMQSMVDRVVTEFEGDVDLFDQLLQDLNKHLTTLRRKSEGSERRNIEAMKGREKLTLARDQADEEIARRVEQSKPPVFVRNMLEQAWSDYLTLTALRHGDDSGQWKDGLNLADQLIASTNPNLDPAKRLALREQQESLRKAVRAALGQVGYKRNDIDVVLANLDECQRWALADDPKVEEAPPVLNKAPAHISPAADGKGKPHTKPILNKGRFGGIPQSKEQVEKVELNADEKTTLAKLRLTPFGTWFEFVQNQQGDVVRRKLSWFSPVTSRCLFVNHKGVKVEERTLHQLAQDMVRGNVRIYQPKKQPLFDRAMSKIFDSLRGNAVPA